MAIPTTVTYSSYTQFKANSPVATQRGGDPIEATWKIFALRAEAMIDAICSIAEENKFLETQDRACPIKDSDGNTWMPDDVTMAHIYITSDLILKGDSVAYDGMEVKRENWSGSGYSVDKDKKSQGSSNDDKIEIPPFARRLLRPWHGDIARLTF